MALAAGIFAALVDIVGADHVTLDLAERRRRSIRRDGLLGVVPDAVVRPASTAEVSELMRGAAACGVPILHRSVARTAADGLLPGARGIALSLERMNRVITADLVGGVARVQPHVTAEQLRVTTGYTWPNPTGISADVAGESLRFGTPILGVEAVLPAGEIVRSGGLFARELDDRTLAELLVGPDGTLAVPTELTVGLDTSRASPVHAVAYFAHAASAGAARRTVMLPKRTPPSLHIMDGQAICRVEEPAGLRSASADRPSECRKRLWRTEPVYMDAEWFDTRTFEHGTAWEILLRAVAQAWAEDRSDHAPARAPRRASSRDKLERTVQFPE